MTSEAIELKDEVTDDLVSSPIPCPSCGYDLRGTPLGGSCPECGLAVSVLRSGIHVEGKHLVVVDGAVLPQRCIKTNEPVAEPGRTKTLYWANPLILVAFLINAILGIVLYLVLRKRCRITYAMSSRMRTAYLYRRLVAVMVWVRGFALAIVGALKGRLELLVIGIGLCLAGLILTLAFTTVLNIAKYRDGRFYLRGCGKPFLDAIRAKPTA